MDSADVVTALVALLIIILMAKPLKDVPLWLTVVLAAASYPVHARLLSAWESVVGDTSTWASQAFTVSTALAFAALVGQAVRGFTSLRSERAARRHHCQEIDA